MATYFLTGTYGADAIKGISRKRTVDVTKTIEGVGGKIISIYLLLGEKDLVIIAEFPGLQEAIKGSISISKITAEEFDEFIT